MNRSHRLDLIICLALAVATALVYWDISRHQFVILDDPVYVVRNPHIKSGLTLQSIKWAFTTTRAEFWHPLTWLSYMMDIQVFKGHAAGFLFTNLILHVLNSLMVYLIFIRMTGSLAPSAFVAALFALHPLHVESVAWIAERKDVLSALFWMLTTYAYIHYVERRRWITYATVCIFLILGLMAKPMLVTLPFVLLLWDYWPLGRFKPDRSLVASIPSALALIREKIPLFMITVGFSLTAFLVQKAGGGIDPGGQYPLGDRICNAIISYGAYLFKMIWPDNLAVFYPFPDHFPVWKVGGAACLLIVITLWAMKSARSYPFFIVGWLWYLGTLVPVIGLIKIGDFAMADRYMYIPLIGPSIIIAWGVTQILARLPRKRTIAATAALIALAGLTMTTSSQIRIWTNSFTLFEHALKVTENNYYAHYGLGQAWAGQYQWRKVADHFSKAVELKPTKATLQNDMGRVLARQGKINAAAVHFNQALNIKPQLPSAHFNLANVLVVEKQFDLAVYHFSEALKLHAETADADRRPAVSSVPGYHELVAGHDTTAKIDQAVDQNRRLLAADPHNLEAVRILAVLYAIKGDYERSFAVLQVDTSPQGRVQDIVRGYANWSLIKAK
jgi:hypothetical protein